MRVTPSEEAVLLLKGSLLLFFSNPVALLPVTLREVRPSPFPNVDVSRKLGSAIVMLVCRSSKFTGGRNWKGSEVESLLCFFSSPLFPMPKSDLLLNDACRERGIGLTLLGL